MFVNCLFCQTQRCRRIAELLEKRGAVRAFSPQIVSRQRKQGKNEDVYHDMLPGYVFVYLHHKLDDYGLFSGVDGIVRILGRNNGLLGLTGADLDFAIGLFQRNGIVGVATVIKKGDTVRIQEALFERYEGVIDAIDYRKQRVKVKFNFDDQERTVWMACNVMYKDDKR